MIHMRKTLAHSTKNITLYITKSRVALNLSILHCSTSVEKQEVKTATAPEISQLLLQRYHFSPESASQVASALTRLRNIQRYDSILNFLKDSGFSNTQLEKIMVYKPGLLASNPDKVIKPKIKTFQALGFSASDTAEIITNDPDILHRSLNNRVIPSLNVLKGLFGSSMEVARFLKISGWFLKYDIGKTMVPNVEFLKGCGVEMGQITWLMYNFPRNLLCKPESMRKFVERIDELGIDRRSKMYIHAIRVLSSMAEETWEQKLRAFRNIGFSEDDIVQTFRKAPQVFCVSEEKLKKLKEILVASGKYDTVSIINHPTSLICSIEKRYKPRLQVLEILESKNLIGDWPSFGALFKMTDDGFSKKYVGPHLNEIGDICTFKSAGGCKRRIKRVPST